MGAMASQINTLTIICSTVYSGADHRKHQSSASLAFVWGIHRCPVNSRHKGPVTQKIFHLMTSSWNDLLSLLFTIDHHRCTVNSPHKGPVTRKIFHSMTSSWNDLLSFLFTIDHGCLCNVSNTIDSGHVRMEINKVCTKQINHDCTKICVFPVSRETMSIWWCNDHCHCVSATLHGCSGVLNHRRLNCSAVYSGSRQTKIKLPCKMFHLR